MANPAMIWLEQASGRLAQARRSEKPPPQFFPLNCKSYYSFGDSLLSPEQIVALGGRVRGQSRRPDRSQSARGRAVLSGGRRRRHQADPRRGADHSRSAPAGLRPEYHRLSQSCASCFPSRSSPRQSSPITRLGLRLLPDIRSPGHPISQGGGQAGLSNCPEYPHPDPLRRKASRKAGGLVSFSRTIRMARGHEDHGGTCRRLRFSVSSSGSCAFRPMSPRMAALPREMLRRLAARGAAAPLRRKEEPLRRSIGGGIVDHRRGRL